MIEKTYDNITRAKWRRIKEATAQYNININENTGEAQSYGVMLRWAFFPASKKLAIAILESSMLSPTAALDFVDKIIRES